MIIRHRIWQTALAIFLLTSLGFSQISGGGGLQKPIPVGGEKVVIGIAGQFGGIVNKAIFVKLVKKNASKAKKTGRGEEYAIDKTVSPNNVLKTPSNTAKFRAVNFQPVGNTGFDQELANLLTKKPDEKQALLLIFKESKKAYQTEAQKMGRKNDLALALTFLISTCVTVYHDSPEPTDQATENLYQLLAETLIETPGFAKTSNKNKQLSSDKMVYISGLLLAGYLSSKENNDPQTLKLYQQTAGECLESLMGVSAEKMEFDETGLTIKA